MNCQMEQLPFRGQYFFGPAPSRRPQDFVSVKIVEDRILLHHPRLPVSVQKSGDKTGILLGFAFDTRNPHWCLDDILESLLQNEFGNIVQNTGRIAGRWNLIVLGKRREIAIGDACGTLPLAYYSGGQTTTSVASSTRLLGYCLGNLHDSELIGAEFQKIQTEQNYYSGLAPLVRSR